MKKIISGIQQMGIGVPDVHAAWTWYRKHLGMDIKIFEEAAEANLMLPYTGGKPQSRHAILALNHQGGGGFEIWQYTSRTPVNADFTMEAGDLGINYCRMKSHDIEASFRMLNQAGVTLSEKISDENGHRHFYLRDPYGNIFEMTEGEDWFHRTAYPGGGVYGAVIGVSDIDRALKLYRDVLGYTEIMSDKTGHFKDLEVLPGGKNEFRRVRIGHGAPGKGGFGQMLGSTELELIQVLNRSPRKIFANRFWGDLGYIHLCFDVIHMDALKLECESHGFPFTVDSANSFDMGEAAGHFSYIEDPDGTLIEFVETHKVPVLKKLRWYIDLRKRNPEKPLPRLMLRALSLNRKKD